MAAGGATSLAPKKTTKQKKQKTTKKIKKGSAGLETHSTPWLPEGAAMWLFPCSRHTYAYTCINFLLCVSVNVWNSQDI